MKKKSIHIPAFIMLIIFFSFMFSGNFPVHAESGISSDLVISPEQQYRFAMNYFENSQYDKAAAEFERFIYFFPDHQMADSARYHVGLSYFHGGMPKFAIDPFSEIVENGTDPDLIAKAHFRLSEVFVSLEDYQTAIKVLNHLAETSKNRIIIDESHYRIGWIYLQLNDPEKAGSRFNMVSPENRDMFRIQAINEELSRDKLFPKKNPRLAGFLSIIPGAGFAYCERYQDALVAFLLNAGLILAAYDSFNSGNEALGGVIAFVGAGFYAGNIYGAVSSAHKYNHASHRNFLKNLREKSQVTLSAGPEKQGLVLAFQVGF